RDDLSLEFELMLELELNLKLLQLELTLRQLPINGNQSSMGAIDVSVRQTQPRSQADHQQQRDARLQAQPALPATSLRIPGWEELQLTHGAPPGACRQRRRLRLRP